MPAGIATAPNTKSGSKKGAEETVRNPFVRAAYEHEEPFHDENHTSFGASQIQAGPIDIPSFGYLRSILFYVVSSGGAAGGSNAVAHEDAPWNVLQNVAILDTNGAPIVGPFSGWDLFLIAKWGGYRLGDPNPANTPAFSAVDAGGNFTFLVRLSVEITSRDALGALPNENSSSEYKLDYAVAPNTTVFTTSPNTLPDVRVRCVLETWTQPPTHDLRGTPNEMQPPAVGTTSFWSRTQFNVTQGDQTFRHQRVGNYIRCWIMYFRNDAAPAVRNSTEFPDPFRIDWDGKILTNLYRDVIRHYMRERYGQANDTGVFAFPFFHENGQAGNESRHLYLATTSASRIDFVGNWGGGGVLTVLTNDVQPVRVAPAAA